MYKWYIFANPVTFYVEKSGTTYGNYNKSTSIKVGTLLLEDWPLKSYVLLKMSATQFTSETPGLQHQGL